MGHAIDDGLIVKDHYYVKEFACVFNGEALIGESIKVDIWKVVEKTIHVLLTRSEEKIVLATLLFHDTENCGASTKQTSSL